MRRVTTSVLLAALACYHRPPDTTLETLRGQPALATALVSASIKVALGTAADVISRHGLAARLMADSALVESGGWDPASRDPSVADRYPPEERLTWFVFKVTSDSLGRGSRVAVFALYSPFRTGGTGSGLNAQADPLSAVGVRAVPRDHPSAAMARAMLAEVEAGVVTAPDTTR
ncbi:MAG TPA: hypothetical protein VFK78_03415 [Gemmatimonadales bacterium]|nr:hypothetical protein [Gemmatimonadales bacterium]